MLSTLRRVALAVASGDDGQGLTEYALILALIAVVALASMTLVGGSITTVLSTVANSL
jgi:Flp pilus assembly pilin Flp